MSRGDKVLLKGIVLDTTEGLFIKFPPMTVLSFPATPAWNGFLDTGVAYLESS